MFGSFIGPYILFYWLCFKLLIWELYWTLNVFHYDMFQADFSGALLDLKCVSLGYVSSCIFGSFSGPLADKFGRKLMAQVTFGKFPASSVRCSVKDDTFF